MHTIYGWYTARQYSSMSGTYTLEIEDVKLHPDNGSSPLTVNGVENNILINEAATTTNGRFYDTSVSFLGGFDENDEITRSVSVEVGIKPVPWLSYHKDPSRNGEPFYNVTFKNENFGILSGVGKSGSLLDIDANDKKSNKMSW